MDAIEHCDTIPSQGYKVLRPKPGRPGGLARGKGWTAEDKTIGLVGWLTVGKPGRIQVGRQGW
jgi:hypothetical protein